MLGTERQTLHGLSNVVSNKVGVIKIDSRMIEQRLGRKQWSGVSGEYN